MNSEFVTDLMYTNASIVIMFELDGTLCVDVSELCDVRREHGRMNSELRCNFQLLLLVVMNQTIENDKIKIN